jgi:hypothetical protein
MSRLGIEPRPLWCEVSILEKPLKQLIYLLFGTSPYMAAPVHMAVTHGLVTHGLIPGAQARMWVNRYKAFNCLYPK